MTTEPNDIDIDDVVSESSIPAKSLIKKLSSSWVSVPIFSVIATLAVVFIVSSFIKNDDSSAIANSEPRGEINVEKSGELISESVTLIEWGQYDEAAKLLAEAEKLNPANPLIYYNLGVAQHFSGDLKAAEISYSKSLSIDNRLSSAYYNRGLIRRDQGNLREAAADLEIAAALAKDVDRAPAYFNLGQVLISLGEVEKAEEIIAKAREINPSIGK